MRGKEKTSGSMLGRVDREMDSDRCQLIDESQVDDGRWRGVSSVASRTAIRPELVDLAEQWSSSSRRAVKRLSGAELERVCRNDLGGYASVLVADTRWVSRRRRRCGAASCRRSLNADRSCGGAARAGVSCCDRH